ncbi:uncharacterized protein TNCV_1070681 [Trichonephila clavipes]|nr:uncharacterized protein TNCV_1070681 [Trichonephila clavipes]
MSRTDENISIYERKILRFIFGGIRENGIRRRKSNLELYQSNKESDIVNFTKIQRIKWDGHVKINEDRTTKKCLQCQPIGTRTKDRPNLRRIDGLEKDIVLRTKNWRTPAGRRLAWKRLLEKAKAHPGMSSQFFHGFDYRHVESGGVSYADGPETSLLWIQRDP